MGRRLNWVAHRHSRLKSPLIRNKTHMENACCRPDSIGSRTCYQTHLVLAPVAQAQLCDPLMDLDRAMIRPCRDWKLPWSEFPDRQLAARLCEWVNPQHLSTIQVGLITAGLSLFLPQFGWLSSKIAIKFLSNLYERIQCLQLNNNYLTEVLCCESTCQEIKKKIIVHKTLIFYFLLFKEEIFP